ncbi:MAG: RluA family pseudouridine synthase [Candidatus Omnitrophota bacterium]
MNKNYKFKVDLIHANQRIDKYLGECLSQDFSRSEIKKLILQKCVLLNKNTIKPHQKVKPTDIIEVIVQDNLSEKNILPVKIPVNIIYEDGYLLIINKPAGMVVHPAAGHFNDTLVNALLYYNKKLSDINGSLKLGIVHRIDKDTSGLLVIAKDNKSHRFLADEFKTHKVKKVYIAIVHGLVEHDQGQINAPIARSCFNRKKMSVQFSSPKEALTEYQVLKRSEGFSVVKLYPKTGRTHQIRVHMAHLGHPLIGDVIYGGKIINAQLNRTALHAHILGFRHPESNKFVEFEASLPQDMAQFISNI